MHGGFDHGARRAAICAGAIALGLLLGDTGEDTALDLAWSLTLPVAPVTAPAIERSRVVLVDIARPGGVVDRATIARLVQHASTLGAWAIGLDVAFEGPGEAAGDLALAGALGKSKCAVIATSYNRLTLTDRPNHFRPHARAVGLANVAVDPDGFVRRVQHYYREEAFTSRNSLALELAFLLLSHPAPGAPEVVPERTSLVVRAGSAVRFEVPVDDQGRTILAYRGASGSVPVLRPEELLRLDPKTSTFTGKAVVIGAADPRGPDSFETPFHRTLQARISGAEMHAQAVLGLLQSDPPRRAGTAVRAGAVTVAAVGGVAAGGPGGVLGLLLLGALAGAILMGCGATFVTTGVLVAPVGPLAALVAAAAARRLVGRAAPAPAVPAPAVPAPEVPAPEVPATPAAPAAADPIEQALAWVSEGRAREAVELLQRGPQRGARFHWALALALAHLDEVDLAQSHASEMNAGALAPEELYRLARELEERGGIEAATRLYRRIRMQDLDYRDVGERIAALERTAPNVPEVVRRALSPRYRRLELVGAGGQARVYRGHDKQLGRDVAIKVPEDAMMANPEFGRRFIREVETLRRLEHPNIVRVLEVGTESFPYYAMELLAGDTLRDGWGDGSKLPVGEVLDLLLPVLDALALCHERGIVHRDFKPENVLLDERGVPRLSDFGLAYDESRSRLTRTGATLGTPHYMAPEQLEGESAEAAMDIYAFGTVLYEALTGELPFRGRDMYQKVTRDAPPLARALPDVDPELAAVVDACLKRAPRERPATGRALLDRLAPIAARLIVR